MSNGFLEPPDMQLNLNPFQRTLPLDIYSTLAGQEVGRSSWIEISQTRIDAFADVTMDHQFIHVDPIAASATAFGGTIGHGFLTASLLAPMAYEAVPSIEGMAVSINYGINKLRFLAPVRSGESIRGRFILESIAPKDTNVLASYSVIIEILNTKKPAVALEWLMLFLDD